MACIFNKNMTKNIWNTSIQLLISNAFYRSARLMFNIFLNVYIWKETENMQIIALFNIYFLLFHLLGFWGFSFFVKQGYRKIIHTLSLFLSALTYLWLILLWEMVTSWIYIMSALMGICNGMYYINYNTTQFDLTTFKNRGNFEWLKKALRTTTKIIFPSIFWAIISWYDINMAFMMSIILFMVAWYIWNIDFPQRSSPTKYRSFFSIAMNNKKIYFTLIWSLLATFSASMILVELIVSLLILQEVWTEIKLWFSVSIISLLSIIIMYIFGRWVDYKHYNISLLGLTGLYIISLLWIILVPSYGWLLVFSSLCTGVMHLHAIVISVINNNVLHDIADFKEYVVEWQCVKEFAYIIGWILSFIVMYMLWWIWPQGLQFVFYIMILFAGITALFYIRVNIHEIQQ